LQTNRQKIDATQPTQRKSCAATQFMNTCIFKSLGQARHHSCRPCCNEAVPSTATRPVATYFLAVILPWVCLLVVTAATAVSTRPRTGRAALQAPRLRVKKRLLFSIFMNGSCEKWSTFGEI